MKYDFDTVTDRRSTDAVKWNIGENELPMWIADMDLRTAPEIVKAIEKRAGNGIFGYTDIPEEWYGAYIKHWRERYGLEIEKESLVFCTGVIPAISSMVRKLTTPNENAVLLTPVYDIFFNSIVNNGCRPVQCALKLDRETLSYSVDFGDLAAKLSDPQTSLLILCNPHNPTGNIWDRETLARIGELAYQNGVTVISDEIHCDITAPGKKYIPFASVNEVNKKISVTCLSPSKSFNIAGLNSAAVMIPDSFLRHKVWRALNTDEVAEPGVFACVAACAAYNEGEEWLDEMREYVFENRRLANEYIDGIPGLKTVKADATYLLWVDMSGLGVSDVAFADHLREKTGLIVTAGSHYGSGGEGFLRINIACPRSMLSDGLSRLKKGTEMFLNR